MKIITAKQLKNRTGEALRQVMQGEEILVTVRGKPAAVMRPALGEEEKLPRLRSFSEAWADIEKALETSQPFLESWQEAMDWSRKRS
ncbi:MAG: type II toxin-antitoxin system Phd/YefM family antitoxin [Acidobacteriota bacterium]